MRPFNMISMAICLLVLLNNISDSQAACNCPSGMCCSQWGWCGHGRQYCGPGCQDGNCWSSGQAAPIAGSHKGRCTYYNVNVGYTACGTLHGDHEHIVALNSAQFDPHTPNGNPNRNSLCNRRIRVTGPRGTVDVRVVDRCPGCPDGGLDLSPAAFNIVAGNLDVGVVQVSWKWL